MQLNRSPARRGKRGLGLTSRVPLRLLLRPLQHAQRRIEVRLGLPGLVLGLLQVRLQRLVARHDTGTPHTACMLFTRALSALTRNVFCHVHVHVSKVMYMPRWGQQQTAGASVC